MFTFSKGGHGDIILELYEPTHKHWNLGHNHNVQLPLVPWLYGLLREQNAFLTREFHGTIVDLDHHLEEILEALPAFSHTIKELDDEQINYGLDLMNIRRIDSGRFNIDYTWTMGTTDLSLDAMYRNNEEKQNVIVLDKTTYSHFIDDYFTFLEQERDLDHVKNQMYTFITRL